VSFRKTILDMKCTTLGCAQGKAVTVTTQAGDRIGTLVPVGAWILEDSPTIEAICAWRQAAMRMFLVQFESTHARTYAYLKDLSIAQEGRLFFLLFDETNQLIGHLGVSEVNEQGCELDNVMRAVKGGDPRLIYYAEAALLHWCFTNLHVQACWARVVSYNWMAINLHEEIGFLAAKTVALRKYQNGELTCHDVVDKSAANVGYGCTRMVLQKDKFYQRLSWLR
jgi:RimJ/RimL family protein N-acetyltransferase